MNAVLLQQQTSKLTNHDRLKTRRTNQKLKQKSCRRYQTREKESRKAVTQVGISNVQSAGNHATNAIHWKTRALMLSAEGSRMRTLSKRGKWAEWASPNAGKYTNNIYLLSESTVYKTVENLLLFPAFI